MHLFRTLSAAITVMLAATPNVRAGEISDLIASKGLQAATLRLASPANDEERFLAGGVLFLRAIEKTFQRRWSMGLTEMAGPLPILRMDLPPNRNPEPFAPDIAEQIFTLVITDMAKSRVPLDAIQGDFATELSLNDLWFDVNSSTTRDAGEGLALLLGLARTMTEDGVEVSSRVVRFDRADAEWLAAYTHLLAGLGHVVLAYHPQQAVARVVATSDQLAALRDPAFASDLAQYGVDAWINLAAMYLGALRQQPIAAEGAQARADFLKMIGRNRDFWQLVATETDNDSEWIPSDSQTAALGFILPPGTGSAWLAVLGEAEAALNGELLIPYPWIGAQAGLNLQRLFEDPPAFDLIDWVQGAGALPYAERGRVIDGTKLRQFNTLLLGDAMFFAVLLN